VNSFPWGEGIRKEDKKPKGKINEREKIKKERKLQQGNKKSKFLF